MCSINMSKRRGPVLPKVQGLQTMSYPNTVSLGVTFKWETIKNALFSSRSSDEDMKFDFFPLDMLITPFLGFNPFPFAHGVVTRDGGAKFRFSGDIAEYGTAFTISLNKFHGSSSPCVVLNSFV